MLFRSQFQQLFNCSQIPLLSNKRIYSKTHDSYHDSLFIIQNLAAKQILLRYSDFMKLKSTTLIYSLIYSIDIPVEKTPSQDITKNLATPILHLLVSSHGIMSLFHLKTIHKTFILINSELST